jgi:predicted metalloprotease
VAISLIVGGRWLVRNEEMMASCRLELFIMASDKNSYVPTSQEIIFLVVRMWCFVNEGVRERCGRLS